MSVGADIVIDGAAGEGGGQILRSALALAAVSGRAVVIDGIRARRRKPGLMRQHLTAARAVAEVCGGALEGDELGARRLRFVPGAVRGGEYRFAVATAGSACLVFQTVLWPLLAADAPSRVVFEGGTHNPMAPPFDFLARVFVPVLARMGVAMSLRLERPGFYPAGGGRFAVELQPGPLRPLELFDAGPVRAVRARALVANLASGIGRRELAEVRAVLDWPEQACWVERADEAAGTGNVLLLELEREGVSELVCGFGERGKPAERVAREAAAEVQVYLACGAPVGEHLADQLVIPMALAGGGGFCTGALSSHARTNIEVVRRFVPVDVRVDEIPDSGHTRVRFGA